MIFREMKAERENLVNLLGKLREAVGKGGKVTLDQMMDAVGRRSSGPLLLLAGLIISAPLVSDIPGVPTLTGLFILLVSGQVLAGRKSFWLPKWMLRRGVSSGKLRKTIDKWLMPPARFIDRFVGKRLEGLTGSAGIRAVAVAATLLALATPATELIPFSANGVGLAIIIFGLALIARDGVLVLGGFAVVAATLALAVAYRW